MVSPPPSSPAHADRLAGDTHALPPIADDEFRPQHDGRQSSPYPSVCQNPRIGPVGHACIPGAWQQGAEEIRRADGEILSRAAGCRISSSKRTRVDRKLSSCGRAGRCHFAPCSYLRRRLLADDNDDGNFNSFTPRSVGNHPCFRRRLGLVLCLSPMFFGCQLQNTSVGSAWRIKMGRAEPQH